MKEAEAERQRAREEARERVLKEFEKGQLGLAWKSSVTTSGEKNAGECMSPCFIQTALH